MLELFAGKRNHRYRHSLEVIVYPPAIFWWWYFYDAYAPRIFAEDGIIAASGGFLAITMSVMRAREAADINTYGSAKWAGRDEIGKAGLLGPDDVVLGKYNRDYLRHDGPEHVLCFAPTWSGKGVGLVGPSPLTWPGSAIVHDIKGENRQLEAEADLTMPDIADRHADPKFATARLRPAGVKHAGLDHPELELADAALHAEQQAIVRQAGIIDAIKVDDTRLDEPAQFE